MKNLGQYNDNLSIPQKEDVDSLETKVNTNEDNIAMLDSDVEQLNTDVSGIKTALSSKQNTITGAASTIVDDNLTASKVPVSDANGKVSAADGMDFTTSSLKVDRPIIATYVLQAVGTGQDIQIYASGNAPAIYANNASGSINAIFDIEQKQITILGSEGNYVTISGVADATDTHDAVNLRQLNNKIQYSTTDLTAGSSALATGSLYVVYE